jgi:hypothetical protein
MNSYASLNEIVSPEKKEKIFSELCNLETFKDIYDYVNNVLPGWVSGFLKEYSPDYSFLNDNWDEMIRIVNEEEKKNIFKTLIVIVNNECPGDPGTKFVICDFLTKVGFVVRTHVELIPCSVCEKAIVTNSFYKVLKEHSKPVPDKWSPTCSEHAHIKDSFRF